MPSDTNTLDKLRGLTDERFQELLNNGTIYPNMGRNDMAAPGPLRTRHSAKSDPVALGSRPA